MKLEEFIVAAKASCYVGEGVPAQPSRIGSHDLEYRDADFSYRDSYFGGTDFIGQETVWQDVEPIWAMNYFGYILAPQLIDASRAGDTIKAALAEMYAQKRFLGGFTYSGEFGVYSDRNDGNFERFRGREQIEVGGVCAYELVYHGGLIVP